MVQQLRVFVAFAEDLGSVAYAHMVIDNHLFQGL